MKYVPPVGGAADDAYIDAVPANGIEGSVVPAAAVEYPQREIINAITSAGLTPDGAILTQLADAIRALASVVSATHEGRTDNPHAVTAAQIGTYTQAEVDALLQGLTADTVVNLDPSMTAAEIQLLISSQPRHLRGFTLEFNFAAGEYNLPTALVFRGFIGGDLRVVAPYTGSTRHTDQSVHLNATGGDGCLHFENCSGFTVVESFKMSVDTAAASNSAIYAEACPALYLQFSYFVGSSTSYGRGVMASMCRVYVLNSYVEGFQDALYFCYGSTAHVQTNSYINTPPAYGLHAYGSEIFSNGVNPSGSVANVRRSLGGQYFESDVEGTLTAHVGNTSNPHGVTAAQVGAPTTANLAAHTGNTSNPHGVTAAQVGALTTANFGASLAAIGYQQLPSGLVIQWGSTTVAQDSTVSITFPLAFSSAVRSVVAQLSNSQVGGSGVSLAGGNVQSLSTTGFTLVNDNEAATYYWIAIGH